MSNYSFVKYRESIINNMEWSNEKYLNFIEDYRKCRVLWDIRNPNYKNNNTKRKILISLAQKYGMDEGSLRKKIKNLRSAFHREHHRLTNKIKDDHETDDMRKWFAYDALKFILDVTGPYIAKRDELSISAEDSFHHEEDDQDTFDVSTQYIHLPPLIPDPERSKSPEIIPNPVMLSKEEDEYDLFGRSMTMQLRKMPELVALELMQKMQHMVFNARKQLSKEKRKKIKAKPHSVQSITTSKKKVRSPSLMSHMSSPGSTSPACYKIETMSPEADTTRACDRTEEFSYEYVTTEENNEHDEDRNEASSSNMIMKHGKLKRNSKSIDPLEVKQSRISSDRIKRE